MRYVQNLISIFILTIIMGVGFLVINPDRVLAQDRCVVTIEKSADPANDAPFDFLVSGDQNLEFTLTDPSNSSTEITMIAEDNGGSTITVTELPQSAWALEDIECTVPTGGFCGNPNPPPSQTPCLTITEAENGLNFLCLDSSEVTCTFINRSLIRPIPTLSQWGFIAMAGILVLVGIWGITRKKAEA